MGLYILESYREASLFVRLASIFLTAGLYIGWYAYCTTSWGRTFPTVDSDYFYGYGVWRIVDNKFEKDNPTSGTGSHALVPLFRFHTDGWLLKWYGAFQAFATLGFVSINLGYFLIVLLVYVAPCKCNNDLAFWNAINNFFGCVCWLVAIVLFGSEFDKSYDIYGFDAPTLHYSFFLAIIACVCQLVAAILLLLPKRPAVQTA